MIFQGKIRIVILTKQGKLIWIKIQDSNPISKWREIIKKDHELVERKTQNQGKLDPITPKVRTVKKEKDIVIPKRFLRIPNYKVIVLVKNISNPVWCCIGYHLKVKHNKLALIEVAWNITKLYDQQLKHERNNPWIIIKI